MSLKDVGYLELIFVQSVVQIVSVSDSSKKRI